MSPVDIAKKRMEKVEELTKELRNWEGKRENGKKKKKKKKREKREEETLSEETCFFRAKFERKRFIDVKKGL